MQPSMTFRRDVEERRSDDRSQGLLIAVLFAALLHYPLLQVAVAIAGLHPSDSEYAPVSITEVKLLDGLDLSSEMTEEERRRAKRELRRREREDVDEDEDLNGQVVTLPPPKDSRPPEVDTKYLAKENSRVEQETKKYGDPSPMAPGAPGQGQGPAEAEGRSQSPMLATAIVPPELPERTEAEEKGREAAPEAHPLKRRPLSLMEEIESRLQISDDVERLRRDGSASERVGPRAAPESYEELLPSALGGGGGVGDRGTDDYLPDVEDGEETALNARQFKYWSFFQRVKDSLKRNWAPVREFRRADPNGRVYGVRDRLTILSVTLDERGFLEDLMVVEESGVAPLDDEAVRAFRAAQPFPNPPPGLQDDDGSIRFSFSLYLDVQSGWQFRPTRAPGGLR